MAEVEGLGLCGICHKPIQDPLTKVPSPIRHFKGHQLVHKGCHDELEAFKKTPEYKIQDTKTKLGQAKTMLRQAESNIEVYSKILRDLGVDPEE